MSAPNCPFYGRSLAESAEFGGICPPFLLIDTKGNQCALIQSAHSPCRMEMAGQPVEWRACPVFAEISEFEKDRSGE